MKALLVTTRAALIAPHLNALGFITESATSALYATSMLERSQPDVIVSDLALPDMSGVDLLEIVRGDPSLLATGFVLIADATPEEVDARKHDLVVSTQTAPADIALLSKRLVQEVMRQLHLETQASQEREPSIGGSLDDADLLNLVQWLAKSNQSGRLAIEMDGSRGAIYFLTGRPTHAEFGGRIGEEAVIRLFGQAGNAVSGSFSFERFEPDSLELQTKTIRKSLFQLLLDLATLETAAR
jgi:CheY-like chemotaxis protein